MSTPAPAHGVNGYVNKRCRCEVCVVAWRDYQRARTARLTGRRRYYDGQTAHRTLRLTPLADRLLDAASARTERDPRDVVEKLLREHAADITFESVA